MRAESGEAVIVIHSKNRDCSGFILNFGCPLTAQSLAPTPTLEHDTVVSNFSREAIKLIIFDLICSNSLFSRDVIDILKCKIAEPLSFQLSLVIEQPKYISF